MSHELITRVQNAYPKMAEALEALPPKMLSLSSLQPAQPIKLVAGELTAHVKLAKEHIRNAGVTRHSLLVSSHLSLLSLLAPLILSPHSLHRKGRRGDSASAIRGVSCTFSTHPSTLFPPPPLPEE